MTLLRLTSHPDWQRVAAELEPTRAERDHDERMDARDRADDYAPVVYLNARRRPGPQSPEAA